MTEEMKPVNCGCGGEAKHVYHRGFSCVWCKDCGIMTRDFDTEAEAITAWNKAMSGNVQECAKDARCTERTAKVEEVEKPNVFKCGECGQYFHQTSWGSPVEYCSRCGAKLDWNEDIPMEYFENGGK